MRCLKPQPGHPGDLGSSRIASVRREDQQAVLCSVLGLGFSTDPLYSFAGQFPASPGREGAEATVALIPATAAQMEDQRHQDSAVPRLSCSLLAQMLSCGLENPQKRGLIV